MKPNTRIPFPILMFPLALLAHPSSAATVEWRPDGRPSAGAPYDWVVSLSGTDSASVTRHVGAWSWEDNALFDAGAGEPPVGWTHTADWVKLSLTGTTRFTLRLEREANVPGASPDSLSMFPSFTIFAGWDSEGPQGHTYLNREPAYYDPEVYASSWMDGLTYLDHVDNSTETWVERTWDLAPGRYSIVLGSNAPATDTSRQGYRATFTAIPEPGSALLCGLGALCLLRRRVSRG